MLRIYTSITEQHDLPLLAVAALICAIAAYAALGLHGRAVAAAGRARMRWVAAAAVVAGSGIWATHFVAMLAFDPGFAVEYHWGPTLLSIALAIALTGIGLALAAYRPHLALGAGIVVGAGIGAMHFVGMAALHGPAHTDHDTVYVALAFAFGMGFGAAALWTATGARGEGRRVLAAGFLTLGILGLHFTAVAAMTLHAEPGHVPHHGNVNPAVLAFAVVGVTILILGLGIIGTAFDRHLSERIANEAVRLRRYVAELEAVKAQLEATAAEMTRARDAAEAGNRAKSQFLAGMSHELRTPLNAVIGFSEMLGQEPFGALGNPRYREYVEHIRASGTHLLKLINDVLEFSKAAEGALSLDEGDIDVGREIEAALDAMMPQAAKAGVCLANRSARGLPALHADARRVRQILFNLLSNAVKFTPKGGRVSVSAELRADGFAVSVADTGIGIAPEDLATAFERFAQIDSRLARRYEGAGLGLPLTKELVERHGGTIALASEPGKGTTATVVFPLSRVLAPPSEPAAPAADAAMKQRVPAMA